jgi:hypothetical protein
MSVALVTSDEDYITWTSGGGIPQIDSFTFIGWFKPNFGSLTTPNFFSIGETGVAGRSIFQDESQFIIWLGSAGTPQGAIADDTWYCIAWRGNGTELKGYRKLSDATAFSTWTENQGAGTLTENNVSVGRWINNSSWWNGEIRAIKGWNTALTDQQIEDESRQFAPVLSSGLLWYVGLSNSGDTSDQSGNGFDPTVVGLANGATDPTLPPQTARPSSDNTDGAWTPSTGSDLYATIDETPANDADYNSVSSNSLMRVNLGALSTPGAGTQTVRFRGASSPAKKLICRLIEGASTVRGSVTLDPAAAVMTDYSFNPSGIVNYADLDLEFETQDATTPPSNLPSYNALGAGTSATSTTSHTVNYPSMTGATANTALYLIAMGRSLTASTEFAITGGGWTNIGTLEGGTGTYAADTGTRRCTIFRKDTVTGSESGTVTVTLSGGTGTGIRASIVRVDPPAAGYTLTQNVVSGADTTHGTGYSATASSNLTWAVNDLLLIAHAGSTDTATQSSVSITATGVTFGTLTNRASTAITGGFDHRHVIDTVPVTAVGSASAPVYAYTASASTNGPTLFLQIQAIPPSVFGVVSFAELEIPPAAPAAAAPPMHLLLPKPSTLAALRRSF